MSRVPLDDLSDQLRDLGRYLERALAPLRAAAGQALQFFNSHEYRELSRVLDELERRDGNLPEIILDATPAESIDLLRRFGIIRPPRRRGRPRMEDDGGIVYREIAREARAIKARNPHLSWEIIARTRWGISGRHLRDIRNRFPDE